MLGGILDRVLLKVLMRKRACEGGFRGARLARDSLVPEVGGPIVVARGLVFGVGMSEGCGGGVAS